jgi:hypothetical protein
LPPACGFGGGHWNVATMAAEETRMHTRHGFVTPPVPDQPRPTQALLRDVAQQPGSRTALTVLSTVLFLAGAVMSAYPVGTDAFGRWQQEQLAEQLQKPELAQAYQERRVSVGQGLTTLRIPKIGVDVVVVEGQHRPPCAQAPGTTSTRRCRVSSVTSASPATAPRTAVPSTGSTSCVQATLPSSRRPSTCTPTG